MKSNVGGRSTAQGGGFNEILGDMNLSGLFGAIEQGADGDDSGRRIIQNLDLDLIDEDPDQPRTVSFDEKELQGMAEGLKKVGVMSPISVRAHPDLPGRYMINYGARRYRASKLANLPTIPAIIENDLTNLRARQVIENLARNNLSPLEIAVFIERQLAEGESKGEIAALLGKEPNFVTRHLSLIDPPASIARLINHGDIDVTLVYELTNLRKKHPEAVDNWLEDMGSDALGQEITRSAVRRLDKQLQEAAQANKSNDADIPDNETLKRNAKKLQGIERRSHTIAARSKPTEQSQDNGGLAATAIEQGGVREWGMTPEVQNEVSVPSEQTEETFVDAIGIRHENLYEDAVRDETEPEITAYKAATDVPTGIVTVIHRGKNAKLLLDRRPSAPDKGWIAYDDGEIIEAELFAMTLLEISFGESVDF